MKSKRRSSTSPPPPDPVFFLDRNLGAEKMSRILASAGFRVELHHVWFYGRQDVTDEEIIAECGKRSCFLLTADGDLASRYEAEIRQANIGVFVLSNNNEGPSLWGPRIVAARNAFVRTTSHRPRPFVARFGKGGELSVRLL